MKDAWKRNDNRVESFVVTADDQLRLFDLQCTGKEPIIMTVENNDVQIAYAHGRDAWLTLVDGVTVTWDTQNPWNTAFAMKVTGTDAIITFLIGGSSNAR